MILTLLILLCYGLTLAYTCFRIIMDTENPLKAMSYLLFALFIPVIGMLFYFSIGINYRKRKMKTEQIQQNQGLEAMVINRSGKNQADFCCEDADQLKDNKQLIRFIASSGFHPLTSHNIVKVLTNGEETFPAIFSAIRNAQHHIHLEYYIIEDDPTGKDLEVALKMKVKEGVSVRLIYDDFGCRSIWSTWLKRIKAAGIEAIPFNRIDRMTITNRLNYRNHRKLLIVDGKIGFVGGMNVSDRYINKENSQRKFWRDTHLLIEGEGVATLQYQFLRDWNYYSKIPLQPNHTFFPPTQINQARTPKFLQLVTSGPDSAYPTILLSILAIIHSAKEELLITTPYLIPGMSLAHALILAAQKGVTVKLLVPESHQSFFIHHAAQSFYDDFIHAGIEIYLYTKGFVHAKTMVADNRIASIGTANMDDRSLELNFEVNALIYDASTANELRSAFYNDIRTSGTLLNKSWSSRSMGKKFLEKLARLVSPLL